MKAMMVKNLFLLLPVMFSSLIARSQFSDSVQHYVNFGSTGTINRTNTSSSYVLANGLRFSINKKNIRLNSTSSWIYGEQQKTLTNNDFTSTLDFNIFKTGSKFYYWGLANYDKSYSLKINDRLQAGLGIAYNIIDTTTAFLNVSDGIIYEYGSLKLNETTNDNYNLFRNSFRLRYRYVIKNIIIIDGTNFFQNSLTTSNDYIIKSINSVSVKLRKWLNITAAANYNRNQKTNSENLLITFGLTAEKYF
jgi:hypothetical protein